VNDGPPSLGNLYSLLKHTILSHHLPVGKIAPNDYGDLVYLGGGTMRQESLKHVYQLSLVYFFEMLFDIVMAESEHR
jgi:hypothetical protein